MRPIWEDNDLHDGGPVYAETNLENFIVEPFNTLTAFLFVMIAGYWLWRVRGRLAQYPFVFICALVLGIGAVGGTIYHAFRLHSFFLYMDWVPIAVLCLFASVYFIQRVFRSFWITATISAVFLTLLHLIHNYLPGMIRNNLSYLMMAVFVLGSIFLMLKKYKYAGLKWVVLAVVSFGLAITFRISDALIPLPMGTHFLWHFFGAVATHFMFCFLFRVQLVEHKLFKNIKGRKTLFFTLFIRKKLFA